MKTLEKYLKRTEKNLFEIKKSGILFKVITFRKNSIDYFATITLHKNEKIDVDIRKVGDYKRISTRDKEFIDSYLKRYILFDRMSENKKHSIKQSKLIKNKFLLIKGLLENNYDTSTKSVKPWSNTTTINDDFKYKISKILTL